MPSEKALALVIRSVDFSETSKVLTLYTREFGKLGCLAKGGRRLRGPFSGALDLLCVCRIVLIRKHSGSLDLLTEAELVKGFAPQRNSLQVLYAGYYIAELVRELTDEDDPHPELFDAAVESLRELESGGSVPLIVHRFELATLRETGHAPQLDACTACGRSLAEHASAWFSPAAGGLLCGDCERAGGRSLRVSAGTIRVMQRLADRCNAHWRRLQMQPAIAREVAAVTRNAITYLIGKSLKTAQFLGEPPT